MPANSLEGALNTFHPAPLRGEGLKKYYVEQPQNPLKRMAAQLKARRRVKMLFTGHRIAGKTTSLNRLAADLGDRFFVVHFSVLDTLNAYDVHYADLMLALGTRLFQQATDEKLFPKGVKNLVREELLEDIFLWLEKHTTGLGFVSTQTTKKEFGGKIHLLTGEMEAKLSAEASTRKVLRERIEMHLSELLDKISYVLGEVERKGERGVLFIVEDIDKLDLAKARDLFLEHARTLAAPPASIIYTFPVALRHSQDFTHIKNNFHRVYILPNLKLTDRKGAPNPEGRQIMAGIFQRRLNEKLISPDALELLIAASGGLIGALVRLGGLAAEHALVDGKKAIDAASAELAVTEMRGDFKALLRRQDYEVLGRQLAGEKLRNEEAVREALYTGALLEYHNGDPWFGVNPLVRPLLED